MPSRQPAARDDVAARILKHWHEAVPNDRMAHLVKDATRAFLRSLQARLTPHGVSLGHWAFLRILWEVDGLTQRELSAEAGVMEPTTVITLRNMEAMGLVERRQREGNRKNMHVFLTPRGRALKKLLIPLAEEVNELAARGVAAEDVALTRRTLLAMIGNLAGDTRLAAEPPAAATRRNAGAASARSTAADAAPRKRAQRS